LWLRSDHVLNLSECLLFLLFEPLLIELILNLSSRSQLFRAWILNKLWLSFVWMEESQGRDSIYVELLNQVLSFIRVTL
jgi:hypothetical protein